MGEVCLDGVKLGRVAFRARPTHQNQAIGRLRRENYYNAVQFGHDRHESEGYLGNSGLSSIIAVEKSSSSLHVSFQSIELRPTEKIRVELRSDVQLQRQRSYSVVLVFWFALIVLLYAMFEIGSRLILSRISSTAIQLNAIIENIKENDITIDEFVRGHKEYQKFEFTLDKVIGWDERSKLYATCPEDRCESAFRILVLGDSVTAGHGVETGEDFISLLARARYGRDVQILNAAVSGFGLYQMAVKAERELASYDADLILLTYIDNDLIRSASNFMWGKTRPTFALTGKEIKILPPLDLAKVLHQYERAWKQYYFGLWFLNHVWENRRYFLRSFYPEYFSAIYNLVITRLRAQAAAAGSHLVVARLPQAFEFYGREAVKRIFTAVITKLQDDNGIEFLDIEQCVRGFLQNKNINFEEVMNSLHPPTVGHQAYAWCLHNKLLQSIALLRPNFSMSPEGADYQWGRTSPR